jgi:small subunit ribosomal protein S8
MPGSKLKESLAAILVREGYIAGYQVSPTPGKPGKTLEITMKYSADRTRTISGIKRVSKPGLRIYARADKMPRACSAAWAWPWSRPAKGLMTDREARKRRMGGEVLCYVW